MPPRRILACVVLGLAMIACPGRRPMLSSAPTPSPSASLDQGSYRIAGLSFVDASHGYAIVTACGEADCSSEFYATRDGGVSWRWLYDYSPGHELIGVTAATAQDAVFFGAETIATHDAGRTFGGPPDELGPTIAVVAGPELWRVTSDGGCSDPCGVAFHVSRDAGRTWSPMGRPPVAVASGIRIVRRGRHAYVLASVTNDLFDAPIRASADDGATWHDVRDPCAKSAYDRSADLASPDGVTVWLVCGQTPSGSEQKRVVFRSHDSGAHWEIPDPGPLSGTAFYLASNDADRGWLSMPGSPVGASEDAGRTWGTRISYRDNAGWGPITFVDPLHGWIAYEDEVFRTTDGGRTWRHVKLPAPSPG